jgi:hypothetical protein
LTRHAGHPRRGSQLLNTRIEEVLDGGEESRFGDGRRIWQRVVGPGVQVAHLVAVRFRIDGNRVTRKSTWGPRTAGHTMSMRCKEPTETPVPKEPRFNRRYSLRRPTGARQTQAICSQWSPTYLNLI